MDKDSTWYLRFFFWHREDLARQVLKGYLHEKPCSDDLRESPKNAAHSA